MKPDTLFLQTMILMDTIFPLDPAPIAEALPEDSPLALPERTTLMLSNGDVVEVDLFQISAGCWSAKDANHDGRCGWDTTRELALKDLLELCESDVESEE